MHVEKRLDAQPVAHQPQPLAEGVPHGKGKHAVKASQAINAPGFIGVENNFSIRRRAENVTLLLQFLSDLGEVVDLAVIYDPKRAIFVGHRLPASR